MPQRSAWHEITAKEARKHEIDNFGLKQIKCLPVPGLDSTEPEACKAETQPGNSPCSPTDRTHLQQYRTLSTKGHFILEMPKEIEFPF